MNEKKLSKIMEKINGEMVIRSSDIPSIDLYLDQILTLVGENAENAVSASLTKTMINNYSKAGLIKPVKGKKYSKEHVVQMLLMCYLKGVLSIGDIKRIFDGAYSNKSFNGNNLISVYDRFLDVRTTEKELWDNIISHLTKENSLDIKKSNDFLIILLSIVSFSDYLKKAALLMLSEQYPEEAPPEAKPEKAKDKKNKQKEISAE